MLALHATEEIIAPRRPLPMGSASRSQFVAGRVNQIFKSPADMGAGLGAATKEASRPAQTARQVSSRKRDGHNEAMRFMADTVSEFGAAVKLAGGRAAKRASVTPNTAVHPRVVGDGAGLPTGATARWGL